MAAFVALIFMLAASTASATQVVSGNDACFSGNAGRRTLLDGKRMLPQPGTPDLKCPHSNHLRVTLPRSCRNNPMPLNYFSFGLGTGDTVMQIDYKYDALPFPQGASLQFFGSSLTGPAFFVSGFINLDDSGYFSLNPFLTQHVTATNFDGEEWIYADEGLMYSRVSTTPADLKHAADVVRSNFCGMTGLPDWVIVSTNDGLDAWFDGPLQTYPNSYQTMVAVYGQKTYVCYFFRCLSAFDNCGMKMNDTAEGDYPEDFVTGFQHGPSDLYYAWPGSQAHTALTDLVNLPNSELCFEVSGATPVPASPCASRCQPRSDCSGLTGSVRDHCRWCKSDACRGCMQIAHSLQSSNSNAYNSMPDRCLSFETNTHAMNCLCDIASEKNKGESQIFITKYIDRCGTFY